MLRKFSWVSPFLCLAIAPLACAEASAKITPAPSLSHAVHVHGRGSNPLSQLVSEGIAAGNSIISEIISHNTQSTTPVTSQTTLSSTPTATNPTSQTSQSSQFSESSSAHAPTRPLSTGSAAETRFSTTSAISNNGNNNKLIIILAVVISLLVVAGIVLVLWLCMQRRRQRRQSEDDEHRASGRSSKIPEVNVHSQHSWDQGTQIQQHAIPPPSPELLRASRTRDSQTSHSSPSDTTSATPFLTPPVANEGTSTYTSQESHVSSELDGTPISPIAATEPLPPFSPSPVEIDGTGIPWIPRKSSRRKSKLVHYPTQEESSRFDFGFGRQPNQQGSKRHGAFKIPRRPIG